MRILHTSDWHLGRQFGPHSLASDQRAFTDWLLGVVEDSSIDLVVIAGDVFDRAVAPNEAIAHFRSVLAELVAMRTRVGVITGNHDSADRVAPYAELLDMSGIVLRGGYAGIGEVTTLEFGDGPLDLVLLPFLDPQAAPSEFGTNDGLGAVDASDFDASHGRRMRRTHESVLRDAIGIAQRRLTAPRSLAIAHAFVANSTTSDSERDLIVGGTATVPADLFTPFSYTALGHLHRPQNVPASSARYSGTPLPYSFSENHDKSVTVIEMAADGSYSFEECPIPVGRKVRDVKGRIDDLIVGNEQADDSVFVRATLTDPGVVLDAKTRLAKRWPWIVEIILTPEGSDVAQAVTDSAIARRSMTREEVISAYWRSATLRDPSADELTLINRELSEIAREANA